MFRFVETIYVHTQGGEGKAAAKDFARAQSKKAQKSPREKGEQKKKKKKKKKENGDARK